MAIGLTDVDYDDAIMGVLYTPRDHHMPKWYMYLYQPNRPHIQVNFELVNWCWDSFSTAISEVRAAFIEYQVLPILILNHHEEDLVTKAMIVRADDEVSWVMAALTFANCEHD